LNKTQKILASMRVIFDTVILIEAEFRCWAQGFRILRERNAMIGSKPQNSSWEKFAPALIANTCLTVDASGGASAATILILEGTSPAPSDFPDTAPGYILPVGTNLVQGQLHSASSDNEDFLEFQGLAGGLSFSLLGTYNPLGQETHVSYQAFNSQGTSLGIVTLEGEGGLVSGTIPNDCKIIVDVSFSSQGSLTWQMALRAEVAQAPEPAPFLGAALGFSGALAWRRKRAAQAWIQ
jgi:hypothetical protein